MKTKILSGTAALAAGLIFTGCLSNFLSRDPQGVESETSFWQNEDQANRALIGVYDVTGWAGTTEQDEWMIGDIASDDADKGGEGPADFADAEDIKEFKAIPQNSILSERWQAFYNGIGRANQVIEHVPKMPPSDFVTPGLQERIVAEAKFLRAFFYFGLVNTYGGVPLALSVPVGKAQYCFPRATADEVWAQIVKDLTEAAAVLPEKDDPTLDMGRASKGAANGLLAKSYVYMGKWTEAAAAADAVMTSGKYGLELNYADIFTVAHQNGTESIFEVQHVNDGTTNWGDDNEGTITQIFQGPRNNAQPGAEVGWGFDLPTKDLVTAMKKDSNDVRYKASVMTYGDTLWPGHPDTLNPVAENTTGYYSRKYFWEYNNPTDVPSMSDDPANWRVLRYSDLLLLRAEAAANLSDFPKVKALVDQVRTRAHAAALPAVPASKAAAIQAVWDERRIELALEGQRYFDVLRQGRGVALFGTRGYTDLKRYLPIPQIEIDRCSELTQNPY